MQLHFEQTERRQTVLDVDKLLKRWRFQARGRGGVPLIKRISRAFNLTLLLLRALDGAR